MPDKKEPFRKKVKLLIICLVSSGEFPEGTITAGNDHADVENC
jgi:hypothetical protein